MGPCPATPRFLTLADVAEVLNTSSAQVYALVRRGELPAIKIGGRGQWRVESDAARGLHPADVRRDARPSSTSTRSRRPEPAAPDGADRRPLSRPRSPRVTATSRSLAVRAATVNSQRLAGLVGADRHDQGDAVGDPLAVDGGDHVALLQAGVVGRACPRATSSISAPGAVVARRSARSRR